jgi:hypothetical protein
LWIAGPEAPAELLSRKLARFQRFEARFVLITPSNYQQIAAGLFKQPPAHAVNGRHAANGTHEANGSDQGNGKTALAPIGLVPTSPESEEVYRAT